MSRKSDSENGSIFYGMFLATKRKLCYTTDKYGTLGEKLTFKGLHNTN